MPTTIKGFNSKTDVKKIAEGVFKKATAPEATQ